MSASLPRKALISISSYHGVIYPDGTKTGLFFTEALHPFEVLTQAGTDIGGGDEWLIPRVLGDAFKVHISESGEDAVSLHPAEMLFTGTLAGARALDMESRFGNFDVGKEADFVVVDPSGTPALQAVVNYGVRSGDADLARDQTLFALLMGIRESSIAEVYVQGSRVTGA
jgi:guanine deaminase